MALTVLDVVKKAIAFFVVVLVIATVDFILFQVPSHGTALSPKGWYPESTFIDEHHLDDTLIVQYVYYLMHTLTGDFYTSMSTFPGVHIQDMIWDFAANTLFLFGSIMLLSALSASALAAVWRRRASRIAGKSVMGLSILASSAFPAGIPLIIVGLIVKFDISLPIRGYRSEWNYPDSSISFDGFADVAQHAIVPILSGVLISFGLFALVLMSGLQMNQNAGARRLDGYWRALDSEMPFPRYLVAWSMTAAIVVDGVVNYSGLGHSLWAGLLNHDIPLVMASFFVISLIVAASICILDLVVTALRGKPDKRQAPSQSAIDEKSLRTPISPVKILSESWGIYRRSLSGTIALLILVIMTVAALAAPIISTVEDPDRAVNREPFDIQAGWWNPLPPSLERSPYTGFLHPLGTDTGGRDIYSLTVYGLRPALATAGIIFVVVLALSFVIGIFAVETRGVAGSVEKGVGAIFSTGSLGLLAIPPFVFLIGLQMGPSLDHWGIVLAFCVLYSMWSWSAISKVARSRSVSAGGAAGDADWPKVAAATLKVTKYGMLIGLITIMLLDFFGLGDPAIISWGAILNDAYGRDAIIDDLWVWVLAPFVAILLLTSTTFVVLHKLEKAVERAGTMSEGSPLHSI